MKKYLIIKLLLMVMSIFSFESLSFVEKQNQIKLLRMRESRSTFGDISIFNANETKHIDITSISSTKFVVAYKDDENSSKGTAIIGNVNGSTISWGNEYIFNNSFTSKIVVKAFNNSVFGITFFDSSDNRLKAIIGELSGTAITFGTEYNLPCSSSYEFASVECLSDSLFVVIYSDSPGSPSEFEASIGLAQGNVITWGNDEEIFPSSVNCFDISALSSNKFVVTYFDDSDSGLGYVRVGSTDGSNISFGDEVQITSEDIYECGVASLSDTSFVAFYRDSNFFNGYVSLGNVNGDVISVTTEEIVNNHVSELDVCALSESVFVLVYTTDFGAIKSVTTLGIISDDAVIYDNESVFKANNTEYNAITYLSGNEFVIAFEDEEIDQHGKAVIGEYQNVASVSQNDSRVFAGDENAQIIGIEIFNLSSDTTMTATNFECNTGETINLSDIDCAKLFYTGNNEEFSAINQFGSSVSFPIRNFFFTGNQQLEEGMNYFWLAYCIPLDATLGNIVDAECELITINSTDYVPKITEINFSREIYKTDNYPGDCLDFDGINDYIGFNNLVIPKETGTIEYWIRGGELSEIHLYMSDGNSGSYNGFSDTSNILEIHTALDANGYAYFLYQDGTSSSSVNLSGSTDLSESTEWHHFAVSYDTSGYAYLYIDGMLEASADMSNFSFDDNNGVYNYFGKPGTFTRFARGKFDEMRSWNVVRSQEEIRENMYHQLKGFEEGLENYWQFNEANGTYVSDLISDNYGILNNMAGDDWIDSTIPLGEGVSDSQTEWNGFVEFSDTGVSMNFSLHNSTEITVSKIANVPNIIPTSIPRVLDSQYWNINRFGSGSLYVDVTFSVQENLAPNDENNPGSLLLYSRSSNSDSDWTFRTAASSVNALTREIVFDDITEFSQFIIGKNSFPDIHTNESRISFGDAPTTEPEPFEMFIHNLGTDVLNINNISFSIPNFTVDTTSYQIAPSDSCQIIVYFAPDNETMYSGTLTIESDDQDESNYTIELDGTGVTPEIVVLESENFYSVSSIINNIDVGHKSSPTFYDIDSDGLLDMVVGRGTNMYQYEQILENSYSFQLQDDYYSGLWIPGDVKPVIIDLHNNNELDLLIGDQYGDIHHFEQEYTNEPHTFYDQENQWFEDMVESRAAPAFVDLNRDGQLDMIIGETGGYLSHFRQVLNLPIFTLVTEHIQSIDLGLNSAPALSDIDGDGLYDLVVGEFDGNLHHFEQASMNSFSFTHHTSSFSSIDVGGGSSPAFYDIDDDGLLDLVVGENDGYLNHFEQVSAESINFGLLEMGNNVQYSFLIKADNIPEDLVILCPEGFKVSLSAQGEFVPSLSVSPTDRKISQTVYVLLDSEEPGIYNGNISISSLGIQTIEIEVNGTIKSYPADFAGSTLHFDGSDDFVEMNLPIDLLDDYTIEAWFKTDFANTTMDILSGSHENQHGILLEIRSDNQFRYLHRSPFGNSGGNNIYSSQIVNDGQWHHVAAIKSGSNISLIIDGEEAGNNSVVSDFTESIDVLLGKLKPDSSERLFNGTIDEVRFWDHPRSIEEIRENMYLSLSGLESGLIQYWQFNENEGSVTYDLNPENQGLLLNMSEDSWIESSIPFGDGEADSQTEIIGTVSFSNTELSMDFQSIGSAEITVTKIDTTANVNPIEPDEVVEQPYWIVNRYGTGSLDVDLTFTIDDLTLADEINPFQIALFTRASNSDGAWVYLTSASSVNSATDEAYFEEITSFSQFIITRWIQEIDSPQNVTISSDGTNTQITWDEVAGANSYKVFASGTPDGTFEDVTSEGTLGRSESYYDVIPSKACTELDEVKYKEYKRSDKERYDMKTTSHFDRLSVTKSPARTTQTWTTPVDETKKFYYVQASTE